MKDLEVLWRRIAAYLLDCILIFIFAVTLGIIFVSVTQRLNLTITESPITGQFIGFATLTFPAILYFVTTETSNRQASFGKRLFKLKVQTLNGQKAPINKCFARALILLLPWEVAHTAIWHSAPRPFIDTPSNASLIVMIAAQLIVVMYLFVAIATPKRSVAERIVGLEVVRG